MEWCWQLDMEQVVAWRRWLHQHPEPSFHETETSAYIRAALADMEGVEVLSPTPTSVLGVIRGQGPGGTVALRADIDALPITEETGLPYVSQNPGVMHACGHDTHAAMLLGAAAALAKLRDGFSGTVKLIFQHAEEHTPGGARDILASGLLDDVDCFYGAHIIAPLPAGAVYLRDGALMAAQDSFHITIQGRGAHGSMPDKSIDPIMVGAALVMNLNQIVARNISPLENVVLSMGRFTSGDVFNVIPDTARLEGTVRTTSPALRDKVEERVRQVVCHSCEVHGAAYTLDYVRGYPPLVNDPACTAAACRAAEAVLEPGQCRAAQPMMISEDFPYYLEKAPGTYAIVGGGEEADGCGYVNHHPRFQVMETALRSGVQMYVAYALEVLNKLPADEA